MEDKSKKEIMKGVLEKVKLVDAGVKNKYGEECCAKPTTLSEDRIYYPSLYLDSKEAPMLIGSEVEDEVTLLIKAKITSHSLREREGKKDEDFSLEIRQIGVVSTKTKED